MHESVADLLHRISATKGSRFNAARRLEARERQMALLVAIASALVIALTFIPFAYDLPPHIKSDLSVVTMAASVLILAVSLIQYSNNDAVNAEQHHRCGLELNELRGELSAQSEAIDAVGLQKCAQRYAHILDKYSVNHDPVDFDRYRTEHPEIYSLGKLEICRIYCRHMSRSHWPNVLMTIIVGFFIFLIFWHVIPARIAAAL